MSMLWNHSFRQRPMSFIYMAFLRGKVRTRPHIDHDHQKVGGIGQHARNQFRTWSGKAYAHLDTVPKTVWYRATTLIAFVCEIQPFQSAHMNCSCLETAARGRTSAK